MTNHSGVAPDALTLARSEISRLQAQVKQQQSEAREAEREFQREAREIAAEARWEERQSQDGDYGSY
jgi:hypothetical protein